MPDTSALISLVSGLGGAAIGAAAAIYAPMRQFRRERKEKEEARLELIARDEIMRLTSLRYAGRAWFDVLLRAKQNLQAGTDVDIDRFDAELKEAGGNAAEVGYRQPFWPDPTVERLAQAIFDELQTLSSAIRDLILGQMVSLTPEERLRAISDGTRPEIASSLDERVERIQELRSMLNAKLLERIEELSRVAVPDQTPPR